MSTHVSGFQTFLFFGLFLRHFVLAILVTSRVKVKVSQVLMMIVNRISRNEKLLRILTKKANPRSEKC